MKYVNLYFENDMKTVFAVCQSGEIFFLSLDEKVELNRIVYKRAKKHIVDRSLLFLQGIQAKP